MSELGIELLIVVSTLPKTVPLNGGHQKTKAPKPSLHKHVVEVHWHLAMGSDRHTLPS